MNIPQILMYIGGAIVVLLALDNAVDGVCKYFNYTEGDTFCAKIAAWLKKIQADLPK